MSMTPPSTPPAGHPDPLLDQLARLEAQARVLEPDAEARAAIREAVVRYSEDFLESLDRLPAYHVTEDLGAPIGKVPIPEHPPGIDQALALLAEHVDGPGLNPASAGHLGYIPGGGLYAASLGDYLADITNRYAGVFFGGPGAVRLENLLVRWMADLVGYPEGAAGAHLSGGSIANLVAIATARDAHGLRGADYQRAVVYVSSQTHHCVAKAIRVLGLGEAVVRSVPLDERYRMRPDRLAALVAEDRRQGLRPWIAVSSAGSTDVGAVDPLDAIADVSEQEGLWHHVDAAYGAFFVLTGRGRELLRGIDRADSLVLDPHKTLFLPYGSGALLVRDGSLLAATHRYEANYMQDAARYRAEVSPADLSPELTRPFRALRLWLPLMVHGVAPFRAALEEKLLLAQYFHGRARELGFEVGPEPELSVATYRWVPERFRGDDSPGVLAQVNDYNRQLVDAVRHDGRMFVSSTMLEGRFTLRLAAVVHRTHRKHIDLLLDVLVEQVERLGR